MLKQRDALLRLLQDDDPETLGLVKGQLAKGGARALDELHALLASADDVRAAAHLQEVIAGIEEREADDIFAELCSRFEEHGNLEKAAWQLAATFSPGNSFQRSRYLLNEWGAEVGRRLTKAHTTLDRVETLAEFLHLEIGLRGNEGDYYNVENSLLPHVVESRMGIPISLTHVYMLVGERAGLTIDGVGLPGHFIARHGDVFFDPFHGGRRIGFDECRVLMQQQNMELLPEHLAPSTPKQMLVRMLTNVFYVAQRTEPPLAAKVGGWIEALRA